MGKKIGILLDSITFAPVYGTAVDVATTATSYTVYFDNTTKSTGTGGILGSAFLVNSVSSPIAVVTPTYSCTGALVVANANISNTTGLSVDTAYQTTTSGNSCYYTCKTNYSGTNCQTATLVA